MPGCAASCDSLIELGRAALSLDSSDLEAMTLPGRIETIDSKSFVVRVDPESNEVLRAFRAGLPFPAS